MDLVIDANIVFSALISSEGKTSELLFSDNLKLHAPEFLFEEIFKYKEEIIKKSKLSENDFNTSLTLISSRIKTKTFQEFKSNIKKAKEISPDPKDIEYLAIAIKLNCPLWSNDKALKKQKAVKIISTSELLEINEQNSSKINT